MLFGPLFFNIIRLMTGFIFYQVINFTLMITIMVLIGILFERLEVMENRYLFVACFGQLLDLIAWYIMSHTTDIGSSVILIRVSILARIIFGLGFVGYMRVKYSAIYAYQILGVWELGMVASFLYTLFMPNGKAYLGNPHMVSVGGMMVLSADRGVVYYFYLFTVFLMGMWSVINVTRNRKNPQMIGHKAVRINDMYCYAVAIALVVSFVFAELNFGTLVNIVPLSKTALMGIYAILSIRYNLLNFDNLARESLMNDVGAAFFVFSSKYELLYANEIAYSLYPEIADGGKAGELVKIAATKRVFQIKKNGCTYKVTANPIIKNGRIEGYTIIMTDVSDLVELENRAVINEISRKNLLTNISHELKTPLNAIIGASQMLKEHDEVEKFAGIIESSAANLNDVLDDILSASDENAQFDEPENIPYSVCSLVSNVADYCQNRINEKNIRLSVDFSEEIPINAIGDDKRIRKIIKTVLLNAIRYTDEGHISLVLDGEFLIDGKFVYEYIIRDTGKTLLREGTGVEKTIFDNNDLGVDYTTGYGISLMVAKRITESLGGSFIVKPWKEKFNEYVISIPSNIIDRQTLQSMRLNNEIDVTIVDGLDDFYSGLMTGCRNLGIHVEYPTGLSNINLSLDINDGKKYLVFDSEKYSKKISQSPKYADFVKLAVLRDGKIPKDMAPDLIYVKPPLSSLTIFEAYLETLLREKNGHDSAKNLTAPEAKVMVVDDNTINLYVAQNMLANFGIDATICRSGYECIDMIKAGNDYDLIFMDYMMDGMDGIETTAKIRRMKSSIRNVPIIAYTANSVKGAKEKFLAAGMNGCLFKPVDIKEFAKALKDFLPKHLLFWDGIANEADIFAASDSYPTISGVDKNVAIKYSGGNKDLYIEMLSSFADSIPGNIINVKKAYEDKDLKKLSVLSHGIKSLSRTLGFSELSIAAANIEKGCEDGNYEVMGIDFQRFLTEYESCIDLLSPYRIENDVLNEAVVSADATEAVLIKLYKSIEEFEIDETERLFNELWPGDYDSEIRPLMNGLKDSIDRIDYYASKEYVEKMLKIYREE